MTSNAFSKTWCDLFLADVPTEHTQREVEFVQRQLPLPGYAHLLDVACGTGRHASALTSAGYTVDGVDRSPELISEAVRREPRASFHVLDMLDLDRLPTSFDGVLNLWHSFGFYDAATNQSVLEAFRDRLRARGRLVLDLYNRDHAITRPLVERSQRNGVNIETRRTWIGPRLQLELLYDGVPGDCFDWHLYSPETLAAASREAGFEVVLSCAWFDEAIAVSPEHARMQFVLERR
jgi:SAM-dependent methyltransferase